MLLSCSTRSMLKAFTVWPVTMGGCALAGTELANNPNTRTNDSTANLFQRDFMRSLLVMFIKLRALNDDGTRVNTLKLSLCKNTTFCPDRHTGRDRVYAQPSKL